VLYWLSLALAPLAAGFLVRIFTDHHVHHLNPRIPNCRLKVCQSPIPALRDLPTLPLRDRLGTANYVLSDKNRGRMITFRQTDSIVAGSRA